jgi:hypothetical protein
MAAGTRRWQYRGSFEPLTRRMSTATDSAGLTASTGDRISMEQFERALSGLFRSDGTALSGVQAALARDPSFLLGHCLRAGTLVLAGADTHPAGLTVSLSAIECSPRANDRERRHARAARCWLDGDAAGAARLYGEVLTTTRATDSRC